MTTIFLNFENNRKGGPQVWIKRFQNILEQRGFLVTSNIKDNWTVALFSINTQGIIQALDTGRPVVYRVANGYLPLWFDVMNRKMLPKHHLINSNVSIGLQYANTVVYQSYWAKDVLDKNLFNRPDHFKIIYNGVDQNHFRPVTSPPGGLPIIGTVGRIRYRYRLETFFEMSLKLKEPHKLLIIGNLDLECRRILKLYSEKSMSGKISRF